MIVLVVILVLFGSAKIPQLARSLGQAQSEFRKGVREGAQPDADDTIDRPDPPTTPDTST